MGAAASTLDSTTFALAKAEFESVKDSKTDEELFIHMQKFIESKNSLITDSSVIDTRQVPSATDQTNEGSVQTEVSSVEAIVETEV